MFPYRFILLILGLSAVFIIGYISHPSAPSTSMHTICWIKQHRVYKVKSDKTKACLLCRWSSVIRTLSGARFFAYFGDFWQMVKVALDPFGGQNSFTVFKYISTIQSNGQNSADSSITHILRRNVNLLLFIPLWIHLYTSYLASSHWTCSDIPDHVREVISFCWAFLLLSLHFLLMLVCHMNEKAAFMNNCTITDYIKLA